MQFDTASAQFIRDAHWLGGFAELMMTTALDQVQFPDFQDVLLLDIGCGDGSKAETFRRMGMKVVGLERDKNRLAKSSRRFGDVHFYCADAMALPFREEVFDVVFSFSIFQYLDWQKTIQECHRLLKPGGVAIFIENLSGSPFAKTYRLIHRLNRWRYSAFQMPVKHISWDDIAIFKDLYSQVVAQPFHLFSPCLLIRPLLKYRLFQHAPRSPSVSWLEKLHKMDQHLIGVFPWLAKLCWNVVIVARK